MDSLKRSKVHTDESANLVISLNEQNKDKQKREAFKQLKNLFTIDQIKRFPNVPDNARFTPVYSDRKTNSLTKCVIDYIRLSGYFVERSGNEGRVIDNRKTVTDCIGRTKTIGSIQRIKSSGTNGTSDLKMIVRGLFIALEIKCAATHDRQRPEQRSYQLQVEQSGGIYYIVTDFVSFYEWFNTFIREGKQ